jgi:ABC-type nitrate/sulfonate/bicarbonate transport system substrate-binding protein
MRLSDRMRTKADWIVSSLALLAVLALRPSPVLSAQLEAFNLSYSALVPSGAPFWIAHDLQLFEREGIKTQLLYINAAPRVMAAILAGEVQVSLSGVSTVNLFSFFSFHLKQGDLRKS